MKHTKIKGKHNLKVLGIFCGILCYIIIRYILKTL